MHCIIKTVLVKNILCSLYREICSLQNCSELFHFVLDKHGCLDTISLLWEEFSHAAINARMLLVGDHCADTWNSTSILNILTVIKFDVLRKCCQKSLASTPFFLLTDICGARKKRVKDSGIEVKISICEVRCL